MSWSFHRVLIVRHGETEWNRAGRRQGQLDSPLTQAGHRHAHVLAETLSDHSIDSVFSSPLGRAHQTALTVAAKLDRSVTLLPELSEIHHGDFAGLTNDEIEAKHPGELQRRQTQKYTWSFPGGESYADADARAVSSLQRVAAAEAAQPVLVTHEMIGRMLLRTLLDLTPEQALGLSLPHGVVIEVRPAEGRLTRIEPSPAWP